MRIIILANGDIKDYELLKKYTDGFIIACDGGLRHAHAMDVMPNLILGDFDSISPELLEKYKKSGVQTEKLPCRKDFTDMEFAIDFVIKTHIGEISEILILGGIGSRLDHTLGNIAALYIALKNSIHAELIDENNRLFLVGSNIKINATPGALISLIPFSNDVKDIKTKGLEYPLDNEILYMGSSRGVSNVFIGYDAEISVGSGILIIVLSKD